MNKMHSLLICSYQRTCALSENPFVVTPLFEIIDTNQSRISNSVKYKSINESRQMPVIDQSFTMQHAIKTSFRFKKLICCSFCRVQLCQFDDIICLTGTALMLPLQLFPTTNFIDVYGQHIIQCPHCLNSIGHTDGQVNYVSGILFIKTVNKNPPFN